MRLTRSARKKEDFSDHSEFEQNERGAALLIQEQKEVDEREGDEEQIKKAHKLIEKKRQQEDSRDKKKETRDNKNIAKVRNLLFGPNMAEYEKRFRQVEDQLEKQVALIGEQNKKMFTSLELFVKEEVKSLTEQLKQEQRDRVDSLKKLQTELETLTNKFVQNQ